MKEIIKYYNRFCTKKYKQQGFTKSKSTFIRIYGDTIQTFGLKRHYGLPNCTIEFDIRSLCEKPPVYIDMGGSYSLNHFFDEIHIGYSEWWYEPGSDESMTQCMESMVNAIDLYLMPFFERCVDCKSALSEMILLEELFDRNRRKRLQLRGCSDGARPWQEHSLFDPNKFYMALKSRDFDYVHKFLCQQVNHYKTRLQSFNDPDSPKQSDVVIERHLAMLAQRTEELEKLNSGDYSYFDNMVASNEAQMYDYLETKFPKVIQNAKAAGFLP